MVEKSLYEQEIELLFKKVFATNYDLANSELVRLCEHGNTHAQTIMLLKEYFSGRKNFENIRSDLGKLVSDGCELAEKVIFVYDGISAGKKIKYEDIKLSISGGDLILQYMLWGKGGVGLASVMPIYLFMEIPLSKEEVDMAGISILKFLINANDFDGARDTCRQLATNGNVIAQGYLLIMEYFECNIYEFGILPDDCKKNIRLPEGWKNNCDRIYEEGYKFFDLIYEASIYKKWAKFDTVGINHSNIEDFARAALRIMLTGEVYQNDVKIIKFFGAENYPHVIITEEEMTLERRENLWLLF